jgi:hypothetical protein
MTQWGNAARLEMQRPTARNSVLLKQYKLYLDENIAKDLPPLPNGLTIVEAISDYLRAFHEHVVNELKKGFAKNYGQHQFRYVSTRASIIFVIDMSIVFNCACHVVRQGQKYYA